MDDPSEADRLVERTCSVEGCERPYYGLGWCQRHYQKLRPRPVCSIEGCDKLTDKRGWCSNHYQKWRKYGDPLGSAPEHARTCSIDGCERKVRSWSWCANHYGSWRKYGDPEEVDRRREAREAPCSVPECEAPSWIRGWCTKHYTRWLRHGDATADMRDRNNRYEVAADGIHILTIIDGDRREHPVLFDAGDEALVRAHRWHLGGQGYAVAVPSRGEYGPGRSPVRMHRLLLELSWRDGTTVDHIDGNRLNNARSNLRLVSQLINGHNREVVNGVGTSRFRGVSWDERRGLWVANCKVNYRKHYLGGFPTEEAAAVAVARFRTEQGLPLGY